jgi:hypothetical protein
MARLPDEEINNIEAAEKSTGDKIVPFNYAKIFKVEDSVNYEKFNFLKFEAFSAPTVNYGRQQVFGAPPYTFKPNERKGSYKFLHPNTEITENISHNYSNDTSTFATALNKFNTNLTSVINSWTQFGSASDKGAVYDAPFLWKDAQRRTFTVTLDLFAYSDMDKDIYEPIMWFRKNSYARRGLTEKDNVKSLGFIKYPSVFKITGGAFEKFNANKKYNYYSLKNISVRYNAMSKFHKDGIPMTATVSLTFDEVINIYADMFGDLGENVVITETLNGNFFDVSEAQKKNIGDIQNNWKGGDGRVGQKKLTSEQKMDINYNVPLTDIQNERYAEVDKINPTTLPFQNLPSIVKGTYIYQKADALLNSNPVALAQHTLEVKNVLGETPSLYRKIERQLKTIQSFDLTPEKIAEVKAIIKDAPNEVREIPSTARAEIKAILRKMKV